MSGGINITATPDMEVGVIQIQLPGAPGPRGVQGVPGPSNILTIGTVSTGAPGSSVVATISGVSPAQTLNLTIPQGSVGATGPANTLAIGTVNTVASTTGASATITGTAPNQTLNLVIPRGYGVIPAGTTGAVLTKLSNTDYDTAWSQPASAATASALMIRDASGRAQVADPSANADVATKNYVDNTAGTSLNTFSALVRRDSGGTIKVQTVGITQATPTAVDQATRKDYVDTGDTNTLNSARRRPTSTFATAAYTLALTDEAKVLYYANAGDQSAQTVTVPTNATVAFPIGSWIDIAQGVNGITTITPAAGVTLIGGDGINGSYTTRSTYSTVRIQKYASDSWFITGDYNSATDKAVAASTNAATASTLVKRDANGRAQVTDPSVAADIATKNYADTQDALKIPLTQKGAASGVPSLDAGSGLLVPTYEEMTEVASPASPAAGKQRFYIDSGTHAPYIRDADGSNRRIDVYWGSGTVFPTSTVGSLRIGDKCVRTDIGTNGTMFFYNNSGGWSVMGEQIVCTSTTVPTSGLYAGVRRFDTDTEMQWTYNGTVWHLTGGRTPSCHVFRKAASAAFAFGARTACTFDTVWWQDGGTWWNATNPTRITAPVSGMYQVSGTIVFPQMASRYAALAVRVNGGTGIYSGTAENWFRGATSVGNAVFYSEMTVSNLLLLNAGDYVEMLGELDGTTSTNITPVVVPVGTASSSMRIEAQFVRPLVS